MRQKAVVLETKGNTARVKVLRSTMCEGCEKRGNGSSCACGALVGANRVMICEADNPLCANPGDAVEVETDSSVVLGYAALVFVLPIVVFFLAYTAADMFTQSVYIPWIAGGLGFVLSFIPILITDRIRSRKSPQIRIISVLHNHDEENEEIE